MSRPICCVVENGKKCQEVSDVCVHISDILKDGFELCWGHYEILAEDIHKSAHIITREKVDFT